MFSRHQRLWLSVLLIMFPLSCSAAWLELQWKDLIPESDRVSLSKPPTYDDTLDGHPYFAALKSQKTVSKLHGTNIKIAGFLVPLEFDGPQTLTEFLFVPTAGACIHTPPPPPNHIIYVTFSPGVELTNYQQAYWLQGKLMTEVLEGTLAVSAYSMKADDVYTYP